MMRLIERFLRSVSDSPQERRFKANDRQFNAQFGYVDNSIKTSKYTAWNFLPLNLFEQFKRLANVYFLGLVILKSIPNLSPLSPVTTAFPLAFVLAATAAKDAYDDYKRHVCDKQLNERSTWLVRGDVAVQQDWQCIQVGDVVKLHNDDSVPADLLVLSTSDPNGLCFVETAELDGETNLKWRSCLAQTGAMGDDERQLGAFDAEALTEPPNSRLYKFDGRLRWRGAEHPLSNSNVLLRGCVLRNTPWCYGLVVFTGADTKIMNNTGALMYKCTAVDRALNTMTVGALLFLVAVCSLCALGKFAWEASDGAGSLAYTRSDYFGRTSALADALYAFTSYLIVCNTVIPISLYVSIELVRLAHSHFINADERMADEATGKTAEARSTTLNEDLGQVGYVFSDKTGTLTRNVMTFKKCSILGRNCGETLDGERQVARGGGGGGEFFRNLALCHTVMPCEANGAEYRAESPDEKALVVAAARAGYAFKSRTSQLATLETPAGLETYEILATLEFDNVRKRMSVVVKRPADESVRVYCKGADASVFANLAPGQDDVIAKTAEHVDEFATDGYRTLCFAYRDVDANRFEQWFEIYKRALLRGDQTALDELIETMESELILSGATAVEDKLQDGVGETLEKLKCAGVKIWLLTGDKTETAVNIGYSCALLNRDMTIKVVDGVEEAQVERQLQELSTAIDRHEADWLATGEDSSRFGLVIDGRALVFALQPNVQTLLFAVASRCGAVVCCRATPIQKSMIVDLVKRNTSAVTLAIGDGANDVPMIKRAHIGVGVSGNEGAQAVLASDFSIAQFRFLQRLLLVHGRYSYVRIAKFLRYFFFKATAFSVSHVLFAFFCGFSGQAVYGPFFITFYNIFYTSWPVLVMGVLEQDVDAATSLEYPKLYAPGPKGLFFNKRKFVQSFGLAIYTAAAAFVVAYATYYCGGARAGYTTSDQDMFDSVLAAFVIHGVTLRILIDSSFHTAFNFIATFGSHLLYFVADFFYTSVVTGRSDNGLAKAMSEPTFWFALLLMDACLFVPPLAKKAYETTMSPALPVRIKLAKKMRAHSSEPSSA